MTILHFSVPPLPEYIMSGICIGPMAGKHPNRRNIGIFDLLVVHSGELEVTENGTAYQISAGKYLILRPDAHHYGTKECSEDTTYYWLHFQSSGSWSTDSSSLKLPSHDSSELQLMVPNYFTLQIPQFGTLPSIDTTEELLRTLTGLVQHGHHTPSLWKQQLVFQELMEHLAGALEPPISSPSSTCASKAAAYIRKYYREEFKAQTMGEHINFHPVYIARCMQKEFNCSPVEYLLQYRIEQAKLLLLQTDLSISRVAEEVGFNQAAYFTSCFTKQEGISPRKFRKRLFMIDDS